MTGVVPLVRVALVVEIGQLRQPRSVHVDFVYNRVPVGRSLVGKENRFGVVRQFRV